MTIEAISTLPPALLLESTVNVAEPVNKSSIPTATLTHLNEYPLFTAATDAAAKLPLVTSTTNTVASAVTWVAGVQPAKFVYESTDKLGEGILNKVDKFVPNLKQWDVKDVTTSVTSPFKRATDSVTNTIVEVDTAIQKHLVQPVDKAIVQPVHKIVDPVVKGASEFKGKVGTSIHNTKTKVVSQVDPIVGPFNKSLEKYIDQHFPETKKVSKDEYPTELARTIHIVRNVVTKKRDCVPIVPTVPTVPANDEVRILPIDVESEPVVVSTEK